MQKNKSLCMINQVFNQKDIKFIFKYINLIFRFALFNIQKLNKNLSMFTHVSKENHKNHDK